MKAALAIAALALVGGSAWIGQGQWQSPWLALAAASLVAGGTWLGVALGALALSVSALVLSAPEWTLLGGLGLVAGGARRSCFLPKQLKGGAPPAWAARAVSDTPPARSPRSPIPLSLIPPSPRTGLSASEGPGLRLHAVPRPGAPRRTSPSATSHGSSANTLEEDMVFDLAL